MLTHVAEVLKLLQLQSLSYVSQPSVSLAKHPWDLILVTGLVARRYEERDLELKVYIYFFIKIDVSASFSKKRRRMLAYSGEDEATAASKDSENLGD